MGRRKRKIDHYPYLSYKIVHYLKDKKNLTQEQIAELAGVSASFVSHVASEERRASFACETLELIQNKLGESIAYMLASCIPRESIPEEKRDSYKLCLEFLREFDIETTRKEKER